MTRFRYFAHQALFKARLRPGPIARLKQSWLVIQGLSVGEGTRIRENLSINWPNQVAIGSKCNIQNDVCFEYCRGSYEPGRHIIIGDRTFIGRFSEFNITSSIIVGSDCLIASGCKFIDHNHGTEGASPMRDQAQSDAPIVLEDDVWLGVNVVVLKGVNIGKGAVVGAGAVVTKSIPAFEIWAGIPARRVSHR